MRAIVMMALVMAACGGAPAPVAGVDDGALDRRPLDLIVDGQWIGEGVCYGPHRDGQRPGGPAPTTAELREDLTLLGPRWRLLRIYSADDVAASLLALIRAEQPGMRVLLGVWIAGDDAADQAQVDEAIRLARAYSDVIRAIIVGNETQVSWSDHRVDPARLIARLREVRAGTTTPVTTADDFGYWLGPDGDRLIPEVDFLMLHVHAMWNGQQVEDGLTFTRATYAATVARYPGVPVVLGEAGWATSVAPEGEQARLIKGVASDDAQRTFRAAFVGWVRADRIASTYFEAFDERWKGGPRADEVEKHWGLYRAERTPKPALIDEPIGGPAVAPR